MGETEALKEFAKAMLRCAWDGQDADGAFIQEKAEELGLLRKEPYDPERHGESTSNIDAEPGDVWYVFAGPLAEKA